MFPDQSQQAYVKQLCLCLRYPDTPTTQRRNRKGAWAQENWTISTLLSHIFDTPNDFFMSYIWNLNSFSALKYRHILVTSSLRILVKPTECYEHFTSMMYSLLSFPTIASTHIISRPPPNNWLHSSTHILYLQRNFVKKKNVLKSSGWKNDKNAKKYQAILYSSSQHHYFTEREDNLF